MKLLGTLVLAAFAGAIFVGFGSGCGSDAGSEFAGDSPDKNGSSSGNGFGDGGVGGNGGDGGLACTNLCLQQTTCSGGGTTSISGIVMDPAGKVPLYNVLVYVPNAPVDGFVDGASCDRCGSVSGSPLVTTLTGVDGRFKLDNVPVGANIPVVVQIGKWRRQLVVPSVGGCTETPLDGNLTRLPRNKKEGDIPKMALTTGGLDTLECWLRKIGIDDSEFTTEKGDGRINLYAGGQPGGVTQSTKRFDKNHGANAFSKAPSLWNNGAHLLKYDIVLLSCEGVTDPKNKPPEALQAMYEFANAGGRIFASHWHRFWFDTSAKLALDDATAEPTGSIVSPFEPIAKWQDRLKPCDEEDCTVLGTIDQSFAKGKAMHDWLGQPAVHALTSDKLPILEARHNADAVVAGSATSWITLSNAREGDQSAVEYLSFNTPIPAPEDQKCGRVVYSDLHVSAADESGPDWPGGCVQGELSPQEKALEFMLFDLSSCIQPDTKAPTPPVVN